LNEKNDSVEYLIGYEGNAFAFTGDVEEDLLSITAVHPMREEALNEFLSRAGADWSIIHKMIAQGQLIQMNYEGKNYYMRRLSAKPFTGSKVQEKDEHRTSNVQHRILNGKR
jgi:hypothetical protein